MSVRRWTRRSFVCLVATGLGGCSLGVSPQEAPAVPSARLRVVNDYSEDVHIYVVAGSDTTSVGTVNRRDTQVMQLPAPLRPAGAPVRILAAPMSGTAPYLSDVIGIESGDLLRLTLRRNLQESTLAVREDSES